MVEHAWSYCALCHDLLDLRLNRVTIQVSSPSQASSQQASKPSSSSRAASQAAKQQQHSSSQAAASRHDLPATHPPSHTFQEAPPDGNGPQEAQDIRSTSIGPLLDGAHGYARERERGARRLSFFALRTAMQCPFTHTLSLSLSLDTHRCFCVPALPACCCRHRLRDVASDVDKELNDYRSAMEQINSGGGGGKRSSSQASHPPPPPHALSPLTRTPMRHTHRRRWRRCCGRWRLSRGHDTSDGCDNQPGCPSFKRRSVRLLGTRTVIFLFAAAVCAERPAFGSLS